MDNEPHCLDLVTDWGLSLYVEARGGHFRLLMDTGSSFDKLLRNARALDMDLLALDAIFISHWHADHYGALPDLLGLLGSDVEVFVPRKPGWLTARQLGRLEVRLVEAREPMEISPGLWSTGDMGGEHALVAALEGRGVVVMTGCSHPGPETVVQRALDMLKGPGHALIGGLHIHSYHEGLRLGRFLSGAGFKLICPCHCTGPEAKRGIIEAFTGTTLQCGVGRRLEL